MQHGDPLRLDNWPALCRSARAQAYLSGIRSSRMAAAMMEVANRFCQQPPPETDDAWLSRQAQESAVSAIIGGLAQAEAMARLCPAAAEKLFRLANELAVSDLPSTDEECRDVYRRMALVGMEISRICGQY